MTTQFGTTTLDAAPARVVSLGWGDADTLLALGVVPVGILDWFKAWPVGVGPWAPDELGGAKPQILAGPEINFEAVPRCDPTGVTALADRAVDELSGGQRQRVWMAALGHAVRHPPDRHEGGGGGRGRRSAHDHHGSAGRGGVRRGLRGDPRPADRYAAGGAGGSG